MGHIFNILDLMLPDATLHLELPLTASLNYPIDKAPTETNIKSLRQAEKNLDVFWHGIDDRFPKRNGEPLLQILRRYTKDPRELNRTPE